MSDPTDPTENQALSNEIFGNDPYAGSKYQPPAPSSRAPQDFEALGLYSSAPRLAANRNYTVGSGIQRANFNARFAAYAIDAIVTGVIAYVLGQALGSIGGLLGAVMFMAYFTWLESGPAGQTVGMKLLNIRVLSLDGNELGWNKALLRTLWRIPASIILFGGYIVMTWDKNNMCMHDKQTNTLVVSATEFPPPPHSFGKHASD